SPARQRLAGGVAALSVARDIGEDKPDSGTVPPPHARVRDPLSLWNVKVELVRDLAVSRNDDPRAFIGHVTNKAGQRGAAIVELKVKAATEPFGSARRSATPLHHDVRASRAGVASLVAFYRGAASCCAQIGALRTGHPDPS